MEIRLIEFCSGGAYMRLNTNQRIKLSNLMARKIVFLYLELFFALWTELLCMYYYL